MKAHKETYGGCQIEISEEEQLTINKKQIEYEYDDSSKKWSSRYLPYSLYGSLQELARAIARDTEEFAKTSK